MRCLKRERISFVHTNTCSKSSLEMIAMKTMHIRAPLLLIAVAFSHLTYASNIIDDTPEDDILTPRGEVPVDFKTGQLLPEELDDGELEGGDKHIGWTYTSQQAWGIEYPLCLGQKLRQSPIDIVKSTAVLKPNLRLEFIDYDQEVEFQLKNTHHSISVTPIPSISTPTVKLDWLSDGSEFELQEIHFHWGDGINKGSEHEIDGERAAAEMHMVHYKKGINKSEIGNIDNSVLVIGVLIEADSVEQKKLDNIVASASNVNGTDVEFISEMPENLINLLPDDHQSFYTYNGSLTTPPCYEVVTWIVLSNPVYMDQERLVELSNLETTLPRVGRAKISSNHREIQPLLDRPVYVSYNVSESDSLHLPYGSDRFRRAFEEYWRQINAMKLSFRRAFRRIEELRRILLERLGSVTKREA